MNNYFSIGDSLGSMNPQDIARYEAEIEERPPLPIPAAGAGGMAFGFTPKAYHHTGVMLGFIDPLVAGVGPTTCAVTTVNDIAGDNTLIGDRIKVSLDKFHVHNYPGIGTHTILCEFAGKNQVAQGSAEELRFALQFKAMDGAGAAIVGSPIFLGLTVGPDGISFEARCVNVSSNLDDAILAALDDQAFKSGLSLLTTAQPALKPLSALATATVKAVASRSKNKQIHNFKLGLDFGNSATSSRLKKGSYVVVQTNNTKGWKWDQYEWNRQTLSLQPKNGSNAMIDFNYMVFGVEQFTGSAVQSKKKSG